MQRRTVSLLRQKIALLIANGIFFDFALCSVSATIDIDRPIFAISDDNGHLGLANKNDRQHVSP